MKYLKKVVEFRDYINHCSENIADVLTKSNCGSQAKFLDAIQRFFGSDDYEEWITEMIRRNFKNALSDKVPDVEAYIAQWLTNCR